MILATVRRTWERFWFEPDSARSLAILRVIVAAHALWILLSRDFASISGLSDFWATVPVGLRWRYLLFPGHPAFELVLQRAAILALLGALVGVYPRVCCFVGGLLLYHLAPLDVIIWSSTPTARGLTLSPILLVVLAAARSGDALTLWPRPMGAPGLSGEYGWPRRLTWLLVAQVYLFAAYAKLLQAGVAWSAAGNIRRWLLLFTLEAQWPHHALGRWIADRPAWCLAIGIGTVVFEWSFILAVFWKGLRRALVPAALLLQIGILLAMNIHVGETWLVVTFVDWDALIRRLRAWWPGEPGRSRSYTPTVRSISSAAASGEAASSA